MLKDLVYAFRSLRKSPGFAIVALLTLALGIGANTTIFSVVNAVMLKPLRYQDADRLVSLVQVDHQTGETKAWFSYPNVRDVRTRAKSFSEVSGFRFWLFSLSGDDRPEALLGIFASDDLFPALRVQPFLGRGFLPGGDVPGRSPEVIISHRLWKNHFAGNPAVVGSTVTLNQAPVTVVGVLPEDFTFPELVPGNVTLPSRVPDIFMPLGNEVESHENRGNDNYFVIARLKPTVSIRASASEVDRIARQLAAEYPANNARMMIGVRSLQDEVVGTSTRGLLILLGAVAFVLLIACANVANLLLARAAVRQREMALRTALGASRGRLISQMLTESVVLSVLGGALGVLAARWGVQLIRVAAPNNIPRLEEITVDGRVLVFTLLISVVTGLVFGLVPALQSIRNAPSEALKESGRMAGGARRSRLRSALIISEVALSMVLLAGAGLLLRSFSRVASVEPGFDASNVMTLVALLPPTRYPNADSQTEYAKAAIARLASIGGVDTVGAINTIPLSNLGSSTTFEVVGRPAAREADRPVVDSRVVQGGYFRALRIPILAGRDFNLGDSTSAPQVAILNHTAAGMFFPGEDPLGKKVRLFDGDAPARTVIGIVGDTRGQALEKPSLPEVSYPFSQGGSSLVTIVVRTTGDPYAILPAIRRELVGVDPDLSFFLVRSMGDLLSGTLAERRFNLWMLGGFAGAALLLAGIGLYGVIAYSVAQRTRELGVRAALGASRSSLLGMLLKEGMVMTGLGVAIGLAGALAMGHLLGNQLYGVSPFDPVAMGGVVLALFAVATFAIYIPARRATRVDPIIAIRAE